MSPVRDDGFHHPEPEYSGSPDRKRVKRTQLTRQESGRIPTGAPTALTMEHPATQSSQELYEEFLPSTILQQEGEFLGDSLRTDSIEASALAMYRLGDNVPTAEDYVNKLAETPRRSVLMSISSAGRNHVKAVLEDRIRDWEERLRTAQQKSKNFVGAHERAKGVALQSLKALERAQQQHDANTREQDRLSTKLKEYEGEVRRLFRTAKLGRLFKEAADVLDDGAGPKFHDKGIPFIQKAFQLERIDDCTEEGLPKRADCKGILNAMELVNLAEAPHVRALYTFPAGTVFTKEELGTKCGIHTWDVNTDQFRNRIAAYAGHKLRVPKISVTISATSAEDDTEDADYSSMSEAQLDRMGTKMQALLKKLEDEKARRASLDGAVANVGAPIAARGGVPGAAQGGSSHDAAGG